MKKKKKLKADEIKPVVVNRTPGFSYKFKEDLAWWFKQDFEKASKILDLVTAVKSLTCIYFGALVAP